MRKTFRSKDNKAYWQHRWESIDADDVMLNHESYPLKFAIKAINYNKRNQKILEAGCGAGRILSYLHNKNYDVIGIDFIDNAISKIKNKYQNIRAEVGDIINTNFDKNYFDTILAFGLYHNFEVDNVKKALLETKRILKKNGILCFSFRADNLQNYILDKIKTKNNSKNTEFHKLNLKEDELIKLLKFYNLEIIEKEYVVNMPLLFHFKFFRSKEQKEFNEHLGRRDGYTLNKIGRALDKILRFFLIKHYCNVYVFFAIKTDLD